MTIWWGAGICLDQSQLSTDFSNTKLKIDNSTTTNTNLDVDVDANVAIDSYNDTAIIVPIVDGGEA